MGSSSHDQLGVAEQCLGDGQHGLLGHAKTFDARVDVQIQPQLFQTPIGLGIDLAPSYEAGLIGRASCP